jgi:hypothetical protein
MPTVLEAPDVEVREYQEVEPEKPAASQSRLSTILCSLRGMLRSRRVSESVRNDQFESGTDMLARKYPFLFIASVTG